MRARSTALVALLIVTLAPSAHAQRAITAGLSGAQEGQVVQGTIALKGTGSSPAGIRRVTMWVDGDVVAEVTPQGLRQQADVTFDWDTTRYVASDQLSRNRIYEVRVKAISNSGAEDLTSAKVVVDNAPTTPTGLAATASPSGVTIEWSPNPEPDITGYRVERFYANDYVSAAEVTEPTFTETRSPGRYSYRVVAIRHSDVTTSGLESAPTEPVTVSIASTGGAGVGSAGKAGRVVVTRGRNGKKIVTRRVGAGGLPAAAALPGGGLSGLPDLPETVPWGSYEKQLPYKLPKGGVPIEAAPVGSTMRAVWNIVPPDGLRWLALGLLMLVAAGFARLIAWRLQVLPKPAKLDA